MPRKTKDAENTEVSEKKSAAKKTDTKKKTTAVKKASTKKAATTKSTAKKSVSTKKKSATTKRTKKVATTTKKKTVVKKASVPKKPVPSGSGNNVEYYDLPYRYNQTIVKVLAQTPTNLFIYWDISDEDRENYKKQFGENFFETTKPVLKIFNDTMHYDFEVDINDFANSWYLQVNDSKCDYRVELARRPISNNSNINQDYIYISSSNEIEAPNDRILFNTDEKMVYFRNVKTNQTLTKSFANLSFMRNIGKIYNIYDLYKKIYKNENLDDLYNPSSKFF